MSAKDVENSIYKKTNFEKEVNFVKSWAGGRTKILSTDCQSGFLNALQSQGFLVTGIAKNKKEKVKLEQETSCQIEKMSNLKKLGEFEIVTSMFSACNKLRNYIQVDALVSKMKKHLAEDGIIILEIVKRIKPNREELATVLENGKIKRRKQKVKIVGTVNLNGQSYKFKSKFKLFDVEKIASIAKKNGLEIVDVLRDYTTKIPDEFGDNVQIVLSNKLHETKKEEKTRKKQFVTKKGKIKTRSRQVYALVMILMASLGIVCGTWVGDYYNSAFADIANFNYSAEDIEAAKGDPRTINATGTPDKLSATQAFMWAEYKASKLDYIYIKETGKVDAQVSGIPANQQVRGFVTITQTSRNRISASTGMKPVGVKVNYNTQSGTLLLQKGSPKEEDLDKEECGISWDDGEEMTAEAYREVWGVEPGWFVPYIICDSTVASSTSVTKSEEGYTATLTLKTRQNTERTDKYNLMAYTYYVKQIAEMSGVTVTDVESCEITFVLDENFRFKKISIVEQYDIRYGIVPVTCPATLVQEFSYES